ncbi:hypothetical protein ACI2OW_22995 [Pseudomonas shirazica]|uniref:hypothetical protein n=1 Tax=Pseudomonas TaxID=286 RepID=UPI00385493EC
MYTDYLTNPESYKQLEEYFFEIFNNELQKRRSIAKDFTVPHYSAHFADGTPFMDANPIFSAKNTRTGNILRVVITEDVSEYAINHNSIDDFEELCLIMKISDISLTQQDISSWIVEQKE